MSTRSDGLCRYTEQLWCQNWRVGSFEDAIRETRLTIEPSCYDACSSMPYTVPACTSTLYLPTSSSETSSTPTEPQTQQQPSAAPQILAEKLVIVQESPTAFSNTGDEPAIPTNIKFSLELSTTPQSAPSLTLPSATTSARISVAKVALELEDTPSASAPPATTKAPVLEVSKQQVACGKKTKCYDYMTSMNAACPAVKYGG